jgi:TonB-dependent SusC/RagA subfamily outer membrane receptor
MNLSRVNANDIASVSILKDASAAAIYGAKGLVRRCPHHNEERHQQFTKPSVSFDIKSGWKAPTTSTDYITSGFWSVFINDLFMKEHAGYGFTTYDESDYAELWMRLDQNKETAEERPWTVVQNDGSYKYYANFDWYNHYFRKNRPMQDYDVTIKGGSEYV